VEEDRVSGVEFDRDLIEPLANDLDTLGVGPGLVTDRAVVDASEVVRAGDHLQATVVASRGIDCDQAADQQRVQAGGVVPVAVVLVPGPSPPGPGILEDQLVVVVIDLAVEQLLDHRDDSPAAGDCCMDVIVGQLVADLQRDLATFAVGANGRGFPEL